MMKTWKLFAAVPVLAAAAFGGWWGNHLSHTQSSVLGGLRIVSTDAQTTAGSITAQQALTIVEAKLAAMEPSVDWSLSLQGVYVQEFPQLTQVIDNVTGVVRYQRSTAIDAWVVEIQAPAALASGLGVVSNNTSGAVCGHSVGTGVCDPPGTLLNAQVQTGERTPGAICPIPGGVCQSPLAKPLTTP